ncbi:beta-ketoacyl synthase N-terminal-like domain-containing protein, partial [Rhizobium ruizarguesonis]
IVAVHSRSPSSVGIQPACFTACSVSAMAIGDAARLIRSGEADVAICGGAEACIDKVRLGGFAAARALSTGFNETPELASRPFDTARDGFV